jgi:hypothetical protein
MVLPEAALASASHSDGMTLEQAAGASSTRLKVAARPATVGATWMDLFHPGTPSPPSLEARVRVVADIAGALIQIHDNGGLPRPHRRHGRLTPRHVLIGVDGSASLFTAREPFSKLLPPQPDLGYLAPELLTQSGPATQHSDVFSLGALLWEALDNGRLFPHRRAAAISRLIARRSLPGPRIEEEWALPLGDVAMKALSQNPEERYLDGTAFWLALREHLPAPDAARATLSRLAQHALKLELTTEIRDTPPYLASSGMSLPPSTFSGMSRDMAQDAPARYSLHPEPSSRRSSLSRPPTHHPIDDPAWGLSEPPAPRASQLDLSGPGFVRESEAPLVRKPRLELLESEIPPPDRGSVPPVGHRASFQPAPARHASESPISTLHVNLPRELIDASLPFYVSSQPTQRPFPWGALSFAALIFFGVGAAVAFGAVTALRAGPVADREVAPPTTTREIARAAAPAPEPNPTPIAAPVASTTPVPAPEAPALDAVDEGSSQGAPAVALAQDPSAPAVPPLPTDPVDGAAAPAATPALGSPIQATGTKPQAVAKAAEPGHKPAKRAKAKPRRPKLELAPVREPEPPAAEATDDEAETEDPPSGETKDETNTGLGEELPFVDQPY